MKKYDVLIGGYYGFGNIGDEAILESVCRSLRSAYPDVRICVLSSSPVSTARRLSVSAVNRDYLPAVLRAMSESEIYVSGGGSLLQDRTSRRSLYYYALLMLLGKLISGKMYVFANGVGNVKSMGITAAALKSADRISVRDRASFRRLTDMGIERNKIRLTADPALLLDKGGSAAMVLDACGIANKRFFAVSLRNIKNAKPDTTALRLFADSLDAVPLFVSMEDAYDLKLCRCAAERCGGEVFQPKDYSQLLSVLRFADFAVGMRLHFLIAAAAAGIPFGALSYDCKIDGFMEYIGSDAVIKADRISAEALFLLKSKMKAADDRRIKDMCVLARADAEQLVKCLVKADAASAYRKKIENMR